MICVSLFLLPVLGVRRFLFRLVGEQFVCLGVLR